MSNSSARCGVLPIYNIPISFNSLRTVANSLRVLPLRTLHPNLSSRSFAFLLGVVFVIQYVFTDVLAVAIAQAIAGEPMAIQFAGAWNHRHLKHELTFDMQLRRTTWRIGLSHTYLEYGTKDLRFSNEEACVILGCIWNYRVNTAKSMLVW